MFLLGLVGGAWFDGYDKFSGNDVILTPTTEELFAENQALKSKNSELKNQNLDLNAKLKCYKTIEIE